MRADYFSLDAEMLLVSTKFTLPVWYAVTVSG
jgi:hypothetical protein